MWSISDIEAALGRAQIPAEAGLALESAGMFSGVSIDSRTLRPGDLFFCIRGERVDGHQFIEQALAAGARGVVLSERGALERTQAIRSPSALFLVDDTTVALGALASAHRAHLGAGVIGVTGSNGKTTTKELLFGIGELLEPGRTLATRGNLNNQWGLPLSLLAARPEHRLVILELGMNNAGEISVLSRMARPRTGVIVSVSGAHIGHFGSVLDIARAKLELVDGMEPGSFLLYNCRSPGLDLAERICAERKLQLCVFGVEDRSMVKVVPEGLRFPWRGRELLAPGWFNPLLADNRIAALEALVTLGYEVADVAAASESVRAVIPGRFVVSSRLSSSGEKLLVDDTYNANEVSFVASVRAAAGLRPGGRFGLVAGEMGELGERAAVAHARVGQAAGESGYDIVVVAGGEFADLLGQSYLNVNPTGRCISRTDSASIAADAALLEELSECDVVLVKGSRSARTDRVSAALREKGYV